MTQKTKLMVEMKVLEHGEMGEESIGDSQQDIAVTHP